MNILVIGNGFDLAHDINEVLSKGKLTGIDWGNIDTEVKNFLIHNKGQVKNLQIRYMKKINYVNEHKSHRKNQILKYGLGRKIDLLVKLLSIIYVGLIKGMLHIWEMKFQ